MRFQAIPRGCIWLLAFSCCVILAVHHTEAAPMSSYGNSYYGEWEEVPDEVLLELMARFSQSLMRSHNNLDNAKRAVDFGLARGYSGTQEAKHRLGLAAANFPGGPGRRRRSEIVV